MRTEIGAISADRLLRTRAGWRRRTLAGLLLVGAVGCASAPERDAEAAFSEQLDHAEAALAVGELDAALEGFQELTELRPAELRAWKGLAVSHAALGDDLAALAAFRQLDVLSEGKLPPELSRARCAAALRITDGSPAPAVYERRLDPEEALRVLAGPDFLACPEEQRRASALRVHLRFASGALNRGDSLRHYRLALDLDPGNEVASLGLARFALADGDADEAIRVLAAALESNPGSRALVEAAVEALSGATSLRVDPHSAD